ncbi:hypothetical protein AAVH_07255 [Aphelenchoides avenae]|nr:hypothetical protein AAVH_07255 [Aphelenchus avenae]
MLPNETFLHVLHCADYKSLVLAKLAGLRLLRLITKYAAELACRRRFRVVICDGHLVCCELRTGVPNGTTIRYEPGNQQSLAAACRELAGVIGPHLVEQLFFYHPNQWNAPDLDVIFEAAPPLKYVEQVDVFSPKGSVISGVSDVFMDSFAGMTKLGLYFDYEAVEHFDWAFLRRESARNLRLLELPSRVRGIGAMNRFVEELMRFCITLPRLRGGEPLELDLTAHFFSGAFAQRIIELLKGSGCELTFRMKTERGSTLVLDEGEYSVDADGTATRYASDESGIVVEVNGDSVTIQSTAEVPRKKRRTS